MRIFDCQVEFYFPFENYEREYERQRPSQGTDDIRSGLLEGAFS